MLIRFDKNEECRCLCIDKVSTFFGIEMDTVENIRKIKSLSDTFNFFLKKNLKVDIYVDKRLLINPRFAFLMVRNKINTNHNFFVPSGKCVFFYYLSAKELYGINELWMHCICECYDNGHREVFDSFFDKIKREYANIRLPNHSELSEKLSIVLKLRRL